MKKLFALSVLAVAAAAAPAVAAPIDGSTISVAVDASLAKACAFDSGNSTSSLTLGNDARDANGTVAYSCNYIGTPVVTITSANGALAPSDESAEWGAKPVDYQIVYGDRASQNSGSAGLFASQFVDGVSSITDQLGWTSTSAPNETVSPTLSLYLTRPITIAGDYSDTLTFTIAP